MTTMHLNKCPAFTGVQMRDHVCAEGEKPRSAGKKNQEIKKCDYLC